MSFLNALASDGLSVGLRFYTARMSRASETAASAAGRREDKPQTTRLIEAERLPNPPPPPPLKEQTPEEMAAGRAEAKAILAADGSLGLLRASAGEPRADRPAEAAQMFGGGEEEAALVNSGLAAGAKAAGEPEDAENDESEDETEGGDGEGKADGAADKELTEEEQQQVQEMKRRDQEVRAHEQAHISAGGGLAGAASYEYESGPDGRKYAVAGEVPINTRGGSDPERALRDAETVKRAAMAPAEPSSQDRAVAAQASADINRLRGEVAEARREGGAEGGPGRAGAAENGRKPEAVGGDKPDGGREEENGQQSGGQRARTGPAAMFGASAAQANASMDRQRADQAGPAKAPGIKVDTVGISATKRLAANGESFGSHVLSAYAAAKFAGSLSSYRPALASA